MGCNKQSVTGILFGIGNINGKINETVRYEVPYSQKKEVIPTKTEQMIIPDENYNSLSEVLVKQIPEEYIIPQGEINITENGDFDVSTKQLARVSVPEPTGTIEVIENGTFNVKDKEFADVNVPEKKLGTKNITANGVYKASDDELDGYNEVSVETSGVDITEYFSETELVSDVNYFVESTIKQMPDYVYKRLDGMTNYNSLFKYCRNLRRISLFDTSKATSMNSMFYECRNLTDVPLIDMSSVKSASSMFYNCLKLQTIPFFNVLNITDMGSMFSGCSSLQTIPLLNTSKVTSFSQTFSACSSLKNIPLLDTQSATSMSYIFYECSQLEEIPALDTSKCKSLISAFQSCSNLKKIEELNLQSANSIMNMVSNCDNLIQVGGFKDLGKGYDVGTAENTISNALVMNKSINLTHDSLMNIINNLYDIASLGIKPQQLIIGAINVGKLSAEEIQICTEKGWSVI